MPTEKTIQLFTYDELSGAAKEKARNWWLDCRDSSDFEFTVDDFIRCAEILGVDIDMRLHRTMGGGQRSFPEVWWTLSYSQGDGASFAGSYAYKPGAAKAIRQHAPQDAELHRIADALQALQAANQYGLRAKMGQGHGSNFYSHSGTMSVDVEFLDSRKNEREWKPEFAAVEEELTRLMRDLADWLHARLREEDEYQCSEEQIADAMAANEYTFRLDGTRED